MIATFYKLGEHKIIESDTGELRWEAHFGLGRFQEGRCFKKGTLLFLGPAETNRQGFLKGEFLDHLKPLPEWQKTKYYCRGFEIYHCNTGKKVTKLEMQLWMLDQGVKEKVEMFTEKSIQGSNKIFNRRNAGAVTFRLQKFEIIEKPNHQLAWRTYAGPNSLSGGNCIIVEDILFIGSWHYSKSTMSKRHFLANLQQLPEWDKTKYFCPKLSLHECRLGIRAQGKSKGWPGEKRTTKPHDEKQWQYKKGIELNLKKPELPGNRAMIFARWVEKSKTYAAGRIQRAISLFFDLLFSLWKALKGRWHSRKRKRSSIDRNNDET